MFWSSQYQLSSFNRSNHIYGRSRRIPFHEIEYYHSISYEPLAEYGGWGLRFGNSGRAYTVGGKQDVRLGLVDGRQLLIGSQAPGEFARAINAMMEGKR